MKKISLIAFCLIAVMVSSAVPIGSASLEQETLYITNFSGAGLDEKEITFNADGGLDNTLSINMYRQSNVTTAYFSVTGGEHNSYYPTDPKIDVGEDGDYEWMYSGTGYGALGHQTYFSSGMQDQAVFVPKSGSTTDLNVILPKNANILSAEVTLEGTTLSESSYNSDRYIVTQDRSTLLNYAESYDDGTFDEVETIEKVSSYWGQHGVGIADFDNDGDLDFIASSATVWTNNDKPIYFYEKLKSGKFFGDKASVETVTSSTDSMDMGIGDLNGDKNLDFFMCGAWYSSGKIFYGNGDGSFTSSSFNFGNTFTTGKAVEDIDSDGLLDMIILGGSSGNNLQVYWYKNNGGGSFSAAQSTGISNSNGYGLIVEDFDGDSKIDILTGSSTGKWYYSKGNGDGTFAVTQYTGVSVGNTHAGYGDAFDFNFDGKMDMVCMSDYNSGMVNFYEGNGDFTFKNPVEIGDAGTNVMAIAAPPTTGIGSPLNLSIDIGDDSSVDWSTTGDYTSSVKLTGLDDELNAYLGASNDTYYDSYGNLLINVPIKVSGDSAGMVKFNGLSIKYEYTATVDVNPHNGNLVNEFNELISYYENEFDLNVTIPIVVASDSGGKMKLSDMYLEYKSPNRRPILTIPANEFSILEDSLRLKNFIDFDDYINDDYWPDGTGGLRYEVVENDHPEGLDTLIHAHYLDLIPEKDFHGTVQLRVKVTDDGNDAIPRTYDDLWSLSNYFNVTIKPLNDAPNVIDINGFDPHATYLQFNATENMPFNLTMNATDVDNDPVFPLKLIWEFQNSLGFNIKNNMNLELHEDSYFNSSGKEIFSSSVIYIPEQYDVDLGSIYVTLEVTDNNGSNPLSDIIQFVIRVENVNDPPRLNPIDDVNVNEDSTLSFFVKATDEDGDRLIFSTNRTDGLDNDDLLNFNIDSHSGLITFTPTNDNVGLIKVMVHVDDGAGEANSHAETPFQILVLNTNDPPDINRIKFVIEDSNPETPDLNENLTVQFSTDPPHDDDLPFGDSISYEWDFDISDGFQRESTEQNPTHTFPAEGQYTVTMRVRDSKGLSNQTTQKIRLLAPRGGGSDTFVIDEGGETSILESRSGQNTLLIIIIIGVVAALIAMIVLRKRQMKLEEEEVVTFTDKELKVYMPDDLAKDLATLIRSEKSALPAQSDMKTPQTAKILSRPGEMSSPSLLTAVAGQDDGVSVTLPQDQGGEPMPTTPALLPAAPEGTEPAAAEAAAAAPVEETTPAVAAPAEPEIAVAAPSTATEAEPAPAKPEKDEEEESD
jgi:PKD repeat protein